MSKNGADHQVGGVLKQRRLLRGLTIERLAETASVPVDALKRYEDGVIRPTPTHLIQIGKALGVDPGLVFVSALNNIENLLSENSEFQDSDFSKHNNNHVVTSILNLVDAINKSPDKAKLFDILAMLSTIKLQSAEWKKQISSEAKLIRDCAKRLLLVDDDPDVLLVTGRLLQKSGYELTVCSSGDEALARLVQDNSYCAVITDYTMPGLSGLELIKLSREIVPSIPAVIITGYGVGLNAEAALPLVTLLAKPFTRDQIIQCLGELFAMSAQTTA